jgi:ferredoxin
MSQPKILIVGTGPSGVAAGAALLAAGIRPTFIDSGKLVNGKTKSAKVMLVAPQETPGEHSPRNKSTAEKSWFGDSQVYENNHRYRINYADELTVRVANDIGGFSRVWGATWDFVPRNNWPSDCQIDESVINAVDQLVPNSQTRLRNGDANSGLKPNAVVSALVYRFDKRKRTSSSLESSRLAVHAKACIFCSNCLTGCPTDAIWSSSDVLQEWLDKNQIDLIDNAVVTSVYELPVDKVTLHYLDADGRQVELLADKVILAAGAVG